MNISKINNINFGKFEKWDLWDNITISPNEYSTMQKIQNGIDAREGKTIKVFGKIGYPPHIKKYDEKYVRLTTYPLHEDMDVIMLSRADARSSDYKRRSKWMPLNHPEITSILIDYVHKQNGFIRYCKKHPDHEVIRL